MSLGKDVCCEEREYENSRTIDSVEISNLIRESKMFVNVRAYLLHSFFIVATGPTGSRSINSSRTKSVFRKAQNAVAPVYRSVSEVSERHSYIGAISLVFARFSSVLR